MKTTERIAGQQCVNLETYVDDNGMQYDLWQGIYDKGRTGIYRILDTDTMIALHIAFGPMAIVRERYHEVVTKAKQ